MSIYSRVESGTTSFKSRFTKSISYTYKCDCRFGELVPFMRKFCLPGDVWKISSDVLVRFQPMLSPSLTPNLLRVRYFFVPLRQLYSDTELIITGSKDGHLFSGTLPTFPDFLENITDNSKKVVDKYSFWDYLGVQCFDYKNLQNKEFFPANYWKKAYFRIWWDYFRDENIDNNNDFETWFNSSTSLNDLSRKLYSVTLPKDYFTSALPWQLKGTAPAINVSGSASITPNYGNLFVNSEYPVDGDVIGLGLASTVGNSLNLAPNDSQAQISDAGVQNINNIIKAYLNTPQSASVTQLGFTADDLRTMMAQTRIFERLARAGSRYTEFLYSNFGIAPADETLQRPQYLGGYKVPIVTTEVLQTAEDGTTPVGTMRGHGITRAGSQINTFHCKEFGIIMGVAYLLPKVEYTTGIDKELSYKSRFDFFNPSFQHLSEQEVRNGELYVGSDDKNDDTFGFQAYANELRSSRDLTVGDLRDSLSFWTQSMHFNSRPNLSYGFISSVNHLNSFNAPFSYLGSNARPVIMQFANNFDVYRPMVRYSTPGLTDHL